MKRLITLIIISLTFSITMAFAEEKSRTKIKEEPKHSKSALLNKEKSETQKNEKIKIPFINVELSGVLDLISIFSFNNKKR